MPTLVLATANPGKVRELRALLAPDWTVVPQGERGVVAPVETGSTFLDNALLKARHASRLTGLPALADDSGLEVDALGGAPGVYSARYAGEGASDDANNRRLLDALRDVPMARRGARYRCVLAFVGGADDPAPLIAEGAWEGAIALQPSGTGGFGYDPVFLVGGPLGPSAATLTVAEKGRVSHRAQALQRLRDALRGRVV